MFHYRIITDSCCDLTMAQYEALDVTYASLSVVLDGRTYDSFSEPDQLQEFYSRLRAGDAIGTSGVNPNGWKRIMRPILEAGQDILCIAFSSSLSTTHQSARIAADELAEAFPQRTIRIVDSLCFSMGQGLLLHHACRNRDAGATLEENAAWCEDNKLHICHWLAVDSLDHLKRGGRVSPNTVFAGGMLRLKPMLTITEEGVFSPPEKVRGWKGAMDRIIRSFRENAGDFDNRIVCIAHADNPIPAQELADRFRKEFGVEHVMIGYVGGVLGAHLGPDTLSAYYMGRHR